ncbi:MAG: phenylacetate--CoA ligase family protein [Rubrivivax sp.]
MSLVFDPYRSALAWADVLAVTRAGEDAWRQRREQRLDELLTHAARRSPLYRERLGTRDVAALQLADIAPVDKGELMARFDQWVTDPVLTLPALREHVRDPARIAEAFAGRYLVWESSGSSGEPALFVQDAQSMAVSDALEGARGPVAASLSGPLGLGGAWPRLAFVGAVDGHFASVVSLRRACRVNPWLAATVRCFSFLQPIEQLVAALDAWSPAVLSTYPSMAWVLAQERAAGRLRIAPAALWTGGETLTPPMRAALTRAFGATVRDTYGASECLEIASECPQGALHLHADWVILEPVDERHRPVPAGEVGETTLLTNLANRVQPVIRYDIGDRVRLRPGPCACGCTLPMIEVQGRQDDVLSLGGAGRRRVHLAPLALTTVLEDEGGVFDFELHQRGERQLRLVLHGADAQPERLRRARAALRRWLDARGLAGVQLHGHCAVDGGRGRSGKRRRVCRDPSRPRQPGASTPRARSAAKRVRQASKRPSSSASRSSRIRFT